ncbi:lysophospholipid acyltransferase family protein [Ferruginibacter paludis]|uniref:lysophospholipid acyltransferase family protein n=1 Tax=Ferruginibacter paludis TaxID=1310417 RepID=UPI0025B3DA6A|nr:lysophospholipid acyltransferase family protein [Ferruginibacter paludis]MDN3658061.1 lysophospholipid acyltransferase family protein [Ferruginibacter paludis]
MTTFFTKFKESRFVKGIVYAVIGTITYPGINIFNKLQITGMENLHKLPKKNVLFVSNHQTYFAEVITFIHIFCAVSWRKKHGLGIPYYLLWPFTKIYYVAAEETMKKNWISRILSLGGAITVKRTWVKDGKEVRKSLDPSDTRKIERALNDNWVITFPQGTTKPFAPGRKGTAFIIKHHQPIVIPVVIGGYWRAFDKKGLKFKKRGTRLTITFKAPLQIDYNDTSENILEQVMDSIEQSKQYMLKGRHHVTN